MTNTENTSKSDVMFASNLMAGDLSDAIRVRDSYARCFARATHELGDASTREALLKWFLIADGVVNDWRY